MAAWRNRRRADQPGHIDGVDVRIGYRGAGGGVGEARDVVVDHHGLEEAVQLAEQAFLDEFAKLVAHLTERITGSNEDGTPKIFRDSAIDNLCDFFERFRSLKLVSVENGFAWLPSLTWRLDSAWHLLKAEVPHLKRPPSEYMRTNLWFATQPVEEPENPELVVETDKETVEESVARIFAKLEELGYLEPEEMPEEDARVVTDRLAALGYL